MSRPSWWQREAVSLARGLELVRGQRDRAYTDSAFVSRELYDLIATGEVVELRRPPAEIVAAHYEQLMRGYRRRLSIASLHAARDGWAMRAERQLRGVLPRMLRLRPARARAVRARPSGRLRPSSVRAGPRRDDEGDSDLAEGRR